MTTHDRIDLDEALARSGDGAFVIGAEGRIIVWNRAAERILGYTAREAIGRACWEVLAGRDDHGNRLCYQDCQVQSLVKLGEPVQSFDMQTRAKGGRALWLSMSTLVTGNDNGFLITHLFRDVTAAKELLALVRERLSAPGTPPETYGTLTRRELEVLRLLAAGANTKVAAERLQLSAATVRNHVQNILAKFGVHSRLEAVAYAISHHLL